MLVSVASFSQGRKYKKSMEKAITELSEATSVDGYLATAESFDKIASKYDDQWLPFYYVAHTLTIASLEEPDGPTSDTYLDRAKAAIGKARELKPDESEIEVLSAFHILGMMAVDAESRGPMYFEDFNYTLQKAKELNPENPRCYYLEGLLTANMPDFMGGGPAAAKPIYLKALEKFETFKNEDPLWPSWGKALVQQELDNLE